jgi:integrase
MLAWKGYMYHMQAKNRSPKTIASARSAVLIMARHLGGSPEDVTKPRLTAYFADQSADRVGAGRAFLYQVLRGFWKWFAAEYEQPNPMAGIDRPEGKARPVDVPTKDELAKVMAACKKDVRDTAMVSLLLESGLRRFELPRWSGVTLTPTRAP